MRRGEEVASVPHPGRPEDGGQERHEDERAEDAPQEDVAADQGIVEVTREQALPRYEHVRPTPAGVRLEGHVEEPHEEGEEDRVGEDLDDDPELVPEMRDVVGAEQAGHGVGDEHEEGDPESALAVTASQAQVAAGEHDAAHGQREGEDTHAHIAHRYPGIRYSGREHAVGLRPGANHGEPDRAAVVGRGLHANGNSRLVGSESGPRGLAIGIDGGRPLRGGRSRELPEPAGLRGGEARNPAPATAPVDDRPAEGPTRSRGAVPGDRGRPPPSPRPRGEGRPAAPVASRFLATSLRGL